MHRKNQILISIVFVVLMVFIYIPKIHAGEKGTSLLKPSIYYLPVFHLDKQSCGKGGQRTLISDKGTTIARVCTSIYDACLMEGTCILTDSNQKMITLNYTATVKGVRHFKILPQDGCRWGIGPTGACLDPFHTVAADRRFHKVCEVIYVPKLRDMTLPNGLKHNGYLIVRDVGGAIKGPLRFDFFTGIHQALDKNNPFNQAGLADTDHQIEYKVIGGELADRVRGGRNFPTLPGQPN